MRVAYAFQDDSNSHGFQFKILPLAVKPKPKLTITFNCQITDFIRPLIVAFYECTNRIDRIGYRRGIAIEFISLSFSFARDHFVERMSQVQHQYFEISAQP